MYEVKGIPELSARLKRVSEELERTILRSSLRKATKPVEDAMRSRVPRLTGALAKSIATVIRRYKDTGNIVAVVGPKDSGTGSKHNPSVYGYFVEFGYRAVGRAKIKRKHRKGGTLVSAGKVTNVPARPFARPAVAATTQQFFSTLAAEASDALAKESQ